MTGDSCWKLLLGLVSYHSDIFEGRNMCSVQHGTLVSQLYVQCLLSYEGFDSTNGANRLIIDRGPWAGENTESYSHDMLNVRENVYRAKSGSNIGCRPSFGKLYVKSARSIFEQLADALLLFPADVYSSSMIEPLHLYRIVKAVKNCSSGLWDFQRCVRKGMGV